MTLSQTNKTPCAIFCLDRKIESLTKRGIMKANVGKLDKAARIILGLVIISLGIYFQSWWGLIGIIPLTTSLIGWCPAYSIFGISTCTSKQKN